LRNEAFALVHVSGHRIPRWIEFF